MNRRQTVVATALSAIATLSIQLLALVALAPSDFGVFSAAYLVLALAQSILLSVVAEAWSRGSTPTARDRSQYLSASLWISIAAAVAGAFICAIVAPPLIAWSWLIGIAVGGGTYRLGARYFSAHVGDVRGVVWGDLIAALIGLGGFLILLLIPSERLVPMLAVWAAASIASVVASRHARLNGPQAVWRWVKARKDHVRPLLGDSLVMDLSAIGTPFALLPILGTAGFGLYRAVSNVAAPVRLVLNPLRPTIAATPVELLVGRNRMLAVVGTHLRRRRCTAP